MKEAAEKYIRLESLQNLRGKDFRCFGSDFTSEAILNTGEARLSTHAPIVGLEIRYTTLDDEKKVQEMALSTPLRGCIHAREGGACAAGENACPVANVVPIAKLRERQSQLEKLTPF